MKFLKKRQANQKIHGQIHSTTLQVHGGRTEEITQKEKPILKIPTNIKGTEGTLYQDTSH